MDWIINSIPNLSRYIVSQGLSLLRVTWYVPKTILNWTFLKHQEKKKKISYYSIIFQSHSPLNFLVLSEAKVKTAKTPRERLLSQYFWLTKTFLRKPVSMRFQFQFYKPKKTQDSSDKVQISIQIFSCARWTTKPFNMFTSLFWDKGKISTRILIQCGQFCRSTIYWEGIRD